MERSSLLSRSDHPLTLPTYDGSGQAVHPDVIRVDGLFYGCQLAMAVEPYPDGDDALENPSLLCSNDGLSWSVPHGVTNPVVDPPLQAGAWHSDADLLLAPDQTLLLFYRYNSGKGETTCLRKSSRDGVVWSAAQALFSFAQSGKFASPALVFADGHYQMYFVDTINETINLRTSRDSFNWHEPRALLSFDKAWHLDATLVDGWTYLLVNDRHSLYLLRQREHSRWFALQRRGWVEFDPHDTPSCSYKELPIISPSQDAWDGGVIYRSSCLIENGRISVWYGARSKGNEWNVGFTTGHIPG